MWHIHHPRITRRWLSMTNRRPKVYRETVDRMTYVPRPYLIRLVRYSSIIIYTRIIIYTHLHSTQSDPLGMVSSFLTLVHIFKCFVLSMCLGTMFSGFIFQFILTQVRSSKLFCSSIHYTCRHRSVCVVFLFIWKFNGISNYLYYNVLSYMIYNRFILWSDLFRSYDIL